jgi:hypothetical protein
VTVALFDEPESFQLLDNPRHSARTYSDNGREIGEPGAFATGENPKNDALSRTQPLAANFIGAESAQGLL